MYLDFIEGEPYEVKATVTVRASEAVNSPRKKDLRAGTVVTLLGFGTESKRRARISAGSVEGWVSLETKQGMPFLGKLAGRAYPPPNIDLSQLKPAAGKASDSMPLTEWVSLKTHQAKRPEPWAATRDFPAGVPTVMASETLGLDSLLDLSEAELEEAGIFDRSEAYRFARLPRDEKEQYIANLKMDMRKEEEQQEVHDMDLMDLRKSLNICLNYDLPEGEYHCLPGWSLGWARPPAPAR